MDCVLQTDLCVTKGAYKTFRLTVQDENGERVDLTGATVYFTVNDSKDSATPEISKTSADTAEIEILTQSGETLGQADIKIVKSDTLSLAVGVHYYDAWVQLSSGAEYQVAGIAEFRIAQNITSVP